MWSLEVRKVLALGPVRTDRESIVRLAIYTTTVSFSVSPALPVEPKATVSRQKTPPYLSNPSLASAPSEKAPVGPRIIEALALNGPPRIEEPFEGNAGPAKHCAATAQLELKAADMETRTS